MPRVNTAADVFLHIDMTGGPDACWPWKRGLGGRDKRPYFRYAKKRVLAYRLVYVLVFGIDALPDETLLRHKCDNKICCNPHHLKPGTHQDNMDDMKERERHGLPHHVVRRIRKLVAQQLMTHKDIGELYGVARSVVTDIANRKLYDHVLKEEADDG